VTFAATATDPGIKDTLTYSWNFGDNTTPVTGQNVNHTFVDNGNYNVVLTVTDKDKAVTTQTVVVKVDNVAPVIASVTLPQNVQAGTAAQFTAIATDVGTRDTLTYSWNFGDNTAATIGQNSSHTYTTAGTYSVILTVTDSDGGVTTINQNITVAAPPTTGGIRAGGTVTINGSADFDGNTTNRTDDTQIYAGKGISLNGNITLPVKRDAAGNPLKVNGKIVLADNEITLGVGASSTTNPSQYTNFTTATQTITIPNYADIKLQEFTPPVSAVVKTFNIQANPIYTSADWNTKFPPAGTASNPTVVRIINGDLNLPANINLSNYILIVENGNINFYQGNPVLNNVKLIANAGNINLNSTTGTNLSLSASGNINITGNTSLGGTSLINSNGNITTNGGLSMASSTATVKMVANGDLTVNGNTSLRGQLFAKKNVTMNGQTTLVGSVDALLNVTIGGNTTIIAK
jgi:PKD repeat protein